MTFAWRLHFSPLQGKKKKIQQKALILKSIKRKQHTKQTNKTAQPHPGKGSFFSCGFLCVCMLRQVQDVSDGRTLGLDVWRVRLAAQHRVGSRIGCRALVSEQSCSHCGCSFCLLKLITQDQDGSCSTFKGLAQSRAKVRVGEVCAGGTGHCGGP